jgi:Cd2+/Zn2+-exporting ATPase
MKKRIIRISIGAVIFAAALIFCEENLAGLFVYLAAILIIGGDVLLRAVKNIFKGKFFDENFLMTIAAVGAFCIGEYPEAAAVMLFYQVGETFQSLAVARSRKSIAALMDIRPDYANVIREKPDENTTNSTILSDNIDKFDEINSSKTDEKTIPLSNAEKTNSFGITLRVDPSDTKIDEINSLKTNEKDKSRQENSFGETVRVDPSDVKIDEIIVVSPGEKIPLDAVVVEGFSSIDTAALTGESKPRDVGVGDEILSGCVNLSGVIRARVVKEFGESTVAKILDLVENASAKKSASENFITKFARYYTPAVVIFAALLAVIPPIFSGFQNFSEWLYRALTFLVVSCPCALVISIPMSFFGGIGGASKKGVLIKGGNYLEALANAETVVFDKTGTLTKGVLKVVKIISPNMPEEELLFLAAHAEAYSSHPVSAALIRANRNGIDKNTETNSSPVSAASIDKNANTIRKNHLNIIDKSIIKNAEEIAGYGVFAVVNDKKVHVGNARLMEKIGAKINVFDENTGGTVAHVAVDGVYQGVIFIADEIKEDAYKAVSEIKAAGVKKTVMLTGDNETEAKKVADALKIDEYYSGLLPSGKVEKAEELMDELGMKYKKTSIFSKNKTVKYAANEKDEKALSNEFAEKNKKSVFSSLFRKKTQKAKLVFVGDGINDAPVLARADVGIAMGGLGSDAAVEAADVVVMTDEPSKIATAIKIAKKTLSIATQNTVLAIGIKFIVLALSVVGLNNLLWLAVFADVGVAVLAILNAFRALK